MPTTTFDTLLACLLMVTLVLSSMVGVFTVVHPYLQYQPAEYRTMMNHAMAKYLLLEPGNPSNWGSETGTSLTGFGLAKAGFATPFELDIDKVTRLNEENFYNVSFPKVFTALGVQDKPFRIKIEPVFDVTVNLTLQVKGLIETVYHFNVYTKRSNLPVAASLRCYAVIGDYINETTSSTSSLGGGSVEVALPNSLEGTALLIVIARIEPRTMSYTVYSFKHNSEGDPHPRGTYARLSSVSYALRADLSSPSIKITYAKVFTYSYRFDLAEINETLSNQYYSIPKLLDASPMILVGTGLNGSEFFAERVAYPQIPLDFGSSFTGEHDIMDSFSFNFLVSLNSAVYECKITFGGT